MKPVSIALATYNGAGFIAEQLESLARQTVLPAELIVTDDFSTDNTLGIVNAFAAKAPFPVHAVSNPERLGYRKNFLRAASLCKSDIIAFSDQDDVWLPEKLAECLATFDSGDVLLTYHNATVVDVNLKPYATLAPMHAQPAARNTAQSADPLRYGLGFTMVFRRMLLDFSDLWPQSIDFKNIKQPEAHDEWFCFLASCLGTLCYIDRQLVLYRQHGNNSYGWRAAGGLRGKLHNLFSARLDEIEGQAIGADHRAAIMQQIKGRLTGEMQRLAGTAADRYRRFAAANHLRRQIFAAQGITDRLSRFAAVNYVGGYRPRDQWGCGRKALIHDLVHCFLPSGR